MFKVEIQNNNLMHGLTLKLAGCPASGLPAIDWRRQNGIFEEPTNTVQIYTKIISEKIVRALSEFADTYGDIHIFYRCHGAQHPLYVYNMEIPVEAVRNVANDIHAGQPVQEEDLYNLLITIRDIVNEEKNKINKDTLLKNLIDNLPETRLNRSMWLQEVQKILSGTSSIQGLGKPRDC